jgi:hypothetical protein
MLACLCAKPTSRTTKLKSSTVKPTKNNVLKRSHLVHGRCMSVDHYFPPEMGCLPHTFGRERIGYSCGTLFVDHASGKLFNFCQYLNNATETIQSKHRLESLAKQEGIKIHKFTLTMVSLLPNNLKTTLLRWVKYIPSLVLGRIIRMALQNAI